MSQHASAKHSSPAASESAPSPIERSEPAILSAPAAARSATDSSAADRAAKRPASRISEPSLESAPPPAFYPSVPLLPSSADLAFLSTLPTPCVRHLPDPPNPPPASEPHVGTADPRPRDPPATNPRTPSPIAVPTAVHPFASSPPPTVSRPGPSTPPHASGRAAPSNLSSTPPASPPTVPGTSAPTAEPSTTASAAHPLAAEEEDFEPASNLLYCHRRLWTGQTANGVRLQRSDTWALGRTWRRHVRVIEGVHAAPTAPVEMDPAGLPVEVGPGIEPGTW